MSVLSKRMSFLLGLSILCAVWIVVMWQSDQERIQTPPPIKPMLAVPDFKNIHSVAEKKQVFFNYFRKIVDAENARIASVRKAIQGTPQQAYLEGLARKYRLSISNPATGQDVQNLLRRIDQLPSSLVLSQAAIESAWGTSRFATQGYNYFGHWCLRKGCGLVPASRDNDASHEVRIFDSPAASVRAYFLNINSHRAYAKLRKLREEARAQNKPVHGCVLAAGLSKYSARGWHYVRELRQIIRINELSPYGDAACK